MTRALVSAQHLRMERLQLAMEDKIQLWTRQMPGHLGIVIQLDDDETHIEFHFVFYTISTYVHTCLNVYIYIKMQ